MGHWEKVGGEGGANEKTWDWEANKTLEGTYVGKKTNVGDNDSTIYRFEVVDEVFGKEVFGVWNTTVLDTKLAEVKEGDKVRIEYLGRVPSPNKGRQPYKDFGVETWIEQD